MNGRYLFFLPVLGAIAFAPAATPSLEPFQLLKPDNIAAEESVVSNLLSQTNDPSILLAAAQILQVKCVDGPVNTLEYWGPDARTQEQLRASADALLRLIDSAQTNAQRIADSAAEAMRNANDSSPLQEWKYSTGQVTAAERQKVYTEYARLLAAEPEEKKAWEDQALAAARTSSQSDPQPTAPEQLQLAKILLSGGETAQAKPEFAKLMRSSGGDIAEQFQAHYFYCVCDLNAADFARADADLSDLKNWQNRTLVGANAMSASSAAAAVAILEYRIDLARADKAETRQQQLSLEASAIAALQNLLRRQPELKPTVLEHLGERFGASLDNSRVQPLVLEAIMQHGIAPDADAPTLAASQHAAEMVLKRSGEFAPATVDYAAALSAAILDRNGQTLAAANAYLALARRLENRNLKTAATALDRAIELFHQMPGDAADAAYARALAMAVQKPFDRKYLLYAYGQMLVEQKDYRAALSVLQEIAPDDPHHGDAELAEMICMQRLLDGESAPARLASAAQVAGLETGILQHHAGPSLSAVSAIFISAEVSQSLHQPEMTLERLRDLPAKSRGLAQEHELLERGDELRIAALVQLNRPIDAVNVLAGNTGPLNIPVPALAKELDTAFDSAKDLASRAQVAEARVRLAAWLVNHAADQSVIELNRYRLFYADSLRHAGELETNQPIKRADLQKALDIFQELSAHNPADASAVTPLLGQAGVQFDLENYAAVHEILLPLLNAGRLGNGQEPSADTYWEATYELLASSAALADSGHASPEERAETLAYLKRLYIQWGDKIGGKRWHAAFESLRRRIAPGFIPAAPAGNG